MKPEETRISEPMIPMPSRPSERLNYFIDLALEGIAQEFSKEEIAQMKVVIRNIYQQWEMWYRTQIEVLVRYHFSQISDGELKRRLAIILEKLS